MPSKDTKILKLNQYQKSDNATFITYVEKIDTCKINPANSSTSNVSEHITTDFSMSTISFLEA